MVKISQISTNNLLWVVDSNNMLCYYNVVTSLGATHMLNSELPVTLQYQLKTELYEKINSGTWPEGFKIPSESELCDEYGISRTTVREVLNEMVQSGYIVRKQGKGSFVAKPAVEQTLTSSYSLSADLEQQGKTSEFILLSFKEVFAKGSSIELFGLSPKEKLFEVIRIRTIEGQVFAWERALVPPKYMPNATAEDIEKNGLYPTIKAQSGLYPIEAEERIEAVICPESICKEMGLSENTAVMKVKRNTMSQNGYIEKCESYTYGQRLNVHHIIRKR